MPRKLPRVSPLKLRKDLLIAESDLNRARLMEEWDAATEWHRTLSAGARTVGSVASAAALLVSGVRAFRQKRDPRNGAALSWLQPLIKGAGLVASLCETFRSRNGAPNDHTENTER
jgi:hypothetical protein